MGMIAGSYSIRIEASFTPTPAPHLSADECNKRADALSRNQESIFLELTQSWDLSRTTPKRATIRAWTLRCPTSSTTLTWKARIAPATVPKSLARIRQNLGNTRRERHSVHNLRLLSECVFRRQGINSCPYVVLPSLGIALSGNGAPKRSLRGSTDCALDLRRLITLTQPLVE